MLIYSCCVLLSPVVLPPPLTSPLIPTTETSNTNKELFFILDLYKYLFGIITIF